MSFKGEKHAARSYVQQGILFGLEGCREACILILCLSTFRTFLKIYWSMAVVFRNSVNFSDSFVLYNVIKLARLNVCC